MEKGSMLVLAIVTVLIMSIMIAGLLTVGSTEVKTTQNYQLKKKSFYHAVQGLETVIQEIRNSDDPISIQVNKVSSPPIDVDGTRKNYYTGSQSIGVTTVSHFEEIQAPSLVGISLGTESGFVPVMYRVPVTAEVALGSKQPAVTEIEAGVYSLMKNY